MKTIIESYKGRSGSAFGQLPKIFSNSNNIHLLKELEETTSFLSIYKDVSINQRLYHVLFDKGLELCSCGSPKKFSGRLSPMIKKSTQTNYYMTCEDPKCRLDQFINDIKENSNKREAVLVKIKNDKGLTDELIKRTSFLNDHYENIGVIQRFYHIWFNILDLELCPYCNIPKKFKRSNKYAGTCLKEECNRRYNSDRTKEEVFKKYGVENYSQTEEWHKKVKVTNIKKYGTEWQMQSPIFFDKAKITSNIKYGVDHPTKTQEVQDKKRLTNFKKYGVKQNMQNDIIKKKAQVTNMERYGGISSMCSEEVKAKSKATNQKKHGKDWYVQTDEFKKKMKETLMKKYGVLNSMQNEASFTKQALSAMKWKLFEFNSGRLEKVQGYEPFAIRDLLKIGIDEKDIVIKNNEIEMHTGKIHYIGSDNKEHRYFPDTYIISLNKIIEVKSEYTYNCSKTINDRKKDSCKSLGILFEFWIYNGDGTISNIIK